MVIHRPWGITRGGSEGCGALRRLLISWRKQRVDTELGLRGQDSPHEPHGKKRGS